MFSSALRRREIWRNLEPSIISSSLGPFKGDRGQQDFLDYHVANCNIESPMTSTDLIVRVSGRHKQVIIRVLILEAAELSAGEATTRVERSLTAVRPANAIEVVVLVLDKQSGARQTLDNIMQLQVLSVCNMFNEAKLMFTSGFSMTATQLHYMSILQLRLRRHWKTSSPNSSNLLEPCNRGRHRHGLCLHISLPVLDLVSCRCSKLKFSKVYFPPSRTSREPLEHVKDKLNFTKHWVLRLQEMSLNFGSTSGLFSIRAVIDSSESSIARR
jgi:hypothetical protein